MSTFFALLKMQVAQHQSVIFIATQQSFRNVKEKAKTQITGGMDTGNIEERLRLQNNI